MTSKCRIFRDVSETPIKTWKTFCSAHISNSRNNVKGSGWQERGNYPVCWLILFRNKDIVRHTYYVRARFSGQSGPIINFTDTLCLLSWSVCYFCDEKCKQIWWADTYKPIDHDFKKATLLNPLVLNNIFFNKITHQSTRCCKCCLVPVP